MWKNCCKVWGVLPVLGMAYKELWSPFYKTLNRREQFLTYLSGFAFFLALFKSRKWFWLALALILGSNAFKRHMTRENWAAFGKPIAKKGVLNLLERYL
jgi:hypothetical protein